MARTVVTTIRNQNEREEEEKKIATIFMNESSVVCARTFARIWWHLFVHKRKKIQWSWVTPANLRN